MIQIELYIKEITRFLRTMTIKNDYFKDQMLDLWVAEEYRNIIPDYLHPYYRHLMGEYILSDLTSFRINTRITTDEMSDEEVKSKYGLSTTSTISGKTINNTELYTRFDELMFINSVDTKLPVPYTKELLSASEHQKTATLYKIPNSYYDTICTNYPTQVDLIKAITYPIDSVATCISARNYDLIGCDLTQLQENEQTSLYLKVLETLAVIQQRWDVPDFTYEDLYALDIQAKIWNILILALMQQRIHNIRTASVHEYHLWEYLKSHGLDDYSDVLSLEQAVFLYRNMPYLLRRRGTEHNLILLAHKLLSDWNIVITSKNLLQRTATSERDTEVLTTTTCKTYPVINSTIVGKSTLERLKEIDTLDGALATTYYNKTQKAQAELDAFDADSDITDLKLGTIETLTETYTAEQESGLEYTNDTLFTTSTEAQTRLFTNTPHTYLPTKLLEITNTITSTLLKQVYARFMTESLLYHASLGNLDYYLSFIPDGHDSSINVTIKEAMALVIYCTLKETGAYDEGSSLLSEAYLTVPYKQYFNDVPSTYHWNNTEYATFNALRIRPTKIQVMSDTLSRDFIGIYSLVLKDSNKADWVWANSTGCTLGYGEYNSMEQWTIASTTTTITNATKLPYFEWKYWTTTWYELTEEHVVSLAVVEYDYIIDDLMVPYANSDLTSYTAMVEFLNTQAEGYLQIYQEYDDAASPMVSAAVRNVVTDRTLDELVTVDLLSGRTFETMIAEMPDVKEILDAIEATATDVMYTEYAKFGNSILQELLPIDSDYISDNSGVMLNRFIKLKELFVALCSYNVTFLEGDTATEELSGTLPAGIQHEPHAIEYSGETISNVDTIDLSSNLQYYGENTYDGFDSTVSIYSEDIVAPYDMTEDEFILREYVLEDDDMLVEKVVAHTTTGSAIMYTDTICMHMHDEIIRIEDV